MYRIRLQDPRMIPQQTRGNSFSNRQALLARFIAARRGVKKT